MLSAIFFDIDDTLFPTSAFARQARSKAVDAMIAAGLRAARDEVLRVLYELIDEFGSNHEYHYDRLLERFGPESYAPVNRAVIVASGVIAYHDTKFRDLGPYEDANEAVRRLAAVKTVRLGVISSGHAVKQAEKIVRLGFVEHLDPGAIFITDQLSISKTNPLLYHRACETIGVPPSQCMHVGDHPLGDVDPANEAGLVTVLHRRGGKYASVKGRTKPDHTIEDFQQLLDLLREHYGIDAP